jgi:hypothetical protein
MPLSTAVAQEVVLSQCAANGPEIPKSLGGRGFRLLT